VKERSLAKTPEKGETRRKAPPAGSRRARIPDALLVVVVSAVFALGFVRPFVAEVFFVSSGSMSPTLKRGDSVLAARFAYSFGGPERGDLAVLEDPENEAGVLIKRAVGLSGDTVEVRDGFLFVNGERRREPYVDYNLADSTFFGPEKVPAEEVFVMGDNRSNSRDSREFGPVPEEYLLGKVVFRLWPPGRALAPAR
jgi:signal peptidase I